jgi:conjugative relaxase-like TrwC/TraI family protein
VLSIGKLAPGPGAATYYLERVGGCPLDYYTGRGETAGVWIGDGARSLGLHGPLSTPEQEQRLRDLLAGLGPGGVELTKPVLRADPRSRVPTLAVAQALTAAANERGCDVDDLLQQPPDRGPGRTGDKLAKAWQRSRADLDRARRRPSWPAPTLPVDTARQLLKAAGLDAHAVLAETTPTGRLRDRLLTALRYRDARVDVRCPGLDLTLSAPKSVSVLYGLSPNDGRTGDDGVARQVQNAHRLAVAECLAYLELHCTTALRGHHRGDDTDTRVDTDGLIGAAFEHRSSRCGDPQLHTHVVVANLLHGKDGKWSALDTRAIYTHARTAGFVYQAVLRGELTRTLGVQWGPVRNGQAEIAGLPVELLRLFSKRRMQIEAELELVGLDTAAAAQVATLKTRPAKPDPDDGRSLQERWRAEADAAGQSLEVLQAALDVEPSSTRVQAQRQAAAALGPLTQQLTDALLEPTGLTEKRASFDRRDLLRGVCEHLPAGTPVRLTGLRALATRVLRDSRVVPLLGDAPVGSRRYSTREMLALEQDALAIATRLTDPAAAANDTDPLQEPRAPLGVVTDRELDHAHEHAAALGLSGEQRQMLDRLLTSGSGLELVVGAAGSGKTAALAVAARAWADRGTPVQGTALAAIAARVLEDSTTVPSRSLQRLLNQIDQAHSPEQLAGVLPAGGVLVVDEAGMVGTRTLHRLLTLADQTQTKLVLVGDPRQLPEIDAGGLFATLTTRLPASTLVANQRQQRPWEQRALGELRDGDVVKALAAYQRHQRLQIRDSISELTGKLLDDYEQHLTRHDPQCVLVVACSRGDARRLNAQLRQRLLEHGRLGPDELRVELDHGGHRGYRHGEQVLITANDYQRGLLNGTRGTVTHLDPAAQAVTVRLGDGRTVQLDETYLRTGHLTHGYALTAHKAQGVTVDVALVWGTQALTRETGYVAMSRGRQANHLYSTWDLLRRDSNLADNDLDRPLAVGPPNKAARPGLTQAGLAERLAFSGAQRTARSWWRRRPPAPAAPDVVARTARQRAR